MTQKIVQIGNSWGITIPKKELIGKGLGLGDSIDFNYKRAENKHVELKEEYEEFVKVYGKALKNLAGR